MKKIILSFDYEIYFDGKNNYEHLISNTNRIIEIAWRYQLPMVFFIDMAYVVKLNTSGQSQTYKRVIDQILEMKSKGHELQFHFHPHWINAEYDSLRDSWNFDRTEFSFSDICQKYGIEKANSFFKNVYSEFISIFNYKPIAYRAGGLAISNSQGELIDLLHELGFKYDSSVLPGLLMKGMYLDINHENAIDSERWFINKTSGFFQSVNSSEGLLEEIPVMTFKKEKIGLFSRIKTSMRYRVYNFFAPKRKSYLGGTFDHGIFSSKFPGSITFDHSGTADIIIMKHYTNHYYKENRRLMCIMSHPKSFLADSFHLMDRYFKWLTAHKTYRVVGFNGLI